MESPETSTPRQSNVIKGMLICWLLNFLTIVLGFLLISTLTGTVILVGGLGLVQLIYVSPLYMSLKRNSEADTAKGMLIAASLTALLNAGCWSFVYYHPIIPRHPHHYSP
jgi:hypothetical protein